MPRAIIKATKPQSKMTLATMLTRAMVRWPPFHKSLLLSFVDVIGGVGVVTSTGQEFGSNVGSVAHWYPLAASPICGAGACTFDGDAVGEISPEAAKPGSVVEASLPVGGIVAWPVALGGPVVAETPVCGCCVVVLQGL